jgi:adenine-specific DNA methylase
LVTSYQKKNSKKQGNEVRDALEVYVQEGARKMLVAVLEEEMSTFLG